MSHVLMSRLKNERFQTFMMFAYVQQMATQSTYEGFYKLKCFEFLWHLFYFDLIFKMLERSMTLIRTNSFDCFVDIAHVPKVTSGKPRGVIFTLSCYIFTIISNGYHYRLGKLVFKVKTYL